MRTAPYALFCAVLAAFCGVPAAGPAHALTITNEGEETVNIWIEKWLYRLRAGRSTAFNPSGEPVSVLIESRYWRVTCEAAADSEVRVFGDTCIVDGVDSGESRFHL